MRVFFLLLCCSFDACAQISRPAQLFVLSLQWYIEQHQKRAGAFAGGSQSDMSFAGADALTAFTRKVKMVLNRLEKNDLILIPSPMLEKAAEGSKEMDRVLEVHPNYDPTVGGTHHSMDVRREAADMRRVQKVQATALEGEDDDEGEATLPDTVFGKGALALAPGKADK
jgi:hypothetical protein